MTQGVMLLASDELLIEKDGGQLMHILKEINKHE